MLNMITPQLLSVGEISEDRVDEYLVKNRLVGKPRIGGDMVVYSIDLEHLIEEILSDQSIMHLR